MSAASRAPRRQISNWIIPVNSLPEQESVKTDRESSPAIDTNDSRDESDPLTKRVMALERSLHRLRLALYCGLAVVLIAGVLAAEWLFKQSVRRVDEASGSMQTQIDQRAKASRLNIEGELSEIRDRLKAIGGERLSDDASARNRESPPRLDD
jgi:hypothetical protein